MLYDFLELQRAFMTPLANLNGASAQLFSDPHSPLSYTPISRHVAATYDLFHRLGKDYEKPEWNLPFTTIDGKEVKVTPVSFLRRPFCDLIHFKRDLPAAHPPGPTVLLVAPLSGHHATLLRETVRSFLPAHDVYITDWIDARIVPANDELFSLDDYVFYVQEFLRLLGPDTHVVSVCQPTVPVLAAISLMSSSNDPCLPRSMTLMGGPIDTRRSPTEVNLLATTKSFSWFEDNLIHQVPARYPGAGRPVYPGFLQHSGFVAMNTHRHMQSHYDYYLHLIQGADVDAAAHRRFYDEYNAVLDMPAAFYLDTIRVVFQEHLLPTGKWYIDGQKVEPAAIEKVALFTVEGELDDISGQGQTQAAHDLCTNISRSQKTHFTAQGCGHYGIFSGRRWRDIIFPQVAAFIRSSA